jgi:hypothetical protein
MPKTTKNKGPRAPWNLASDKWYRKRVERNRRRDAIARESGRINRER